MKLVPMLYTDPMALANVYGKKTVTRRRLPVEPVLEKDFVTFTGVEFGSSIRIQHSKVRKYNDELLYLIYNTVEKHDVIWQREAFSKNLNKIKYRADGQFITKCKPNMHMPLSACRFFGLVKSIKLHRIHDITEEDAFAEGVQKITDNCFGIWDETEGAFLYQAINPVVSYNFLIQDLYGFEYWQSNPYFVAIEYRSLSSNELMQIIPELLATRNEKDKARMQSDLLDCVTRIS